MEEISLSASEIKDLLLRYRVLLALLADEDLLHPNAKAMRRKLLLVESQVKFIKMAEIEGEYLEKAYEQFQSIYEEDVRLEVDYLIGDFLDE